MQNYKSKNRARKVWIVGIIILLLSLACGSSSKIATINIGEEDLYKELQETLKIDYRTLSKLSIQSLNLTGDLLSLRVLLEFEDGRSIPGEINFSLFVEEGKFQVEATSLEFEGIQLKDELLQIISSKIKDTLISFIDEHRDRMKINEVKIFENGLWLRIEIHPTPSPMIKY